MARWYARATKRRSVGFWPSGQTAFSVTGRWSVRVDGRYSGKLSGDGSGGVGEHRAAGPLRRLERPECEERSMEAENQGVARGSATGTPAERPPRSRAGWPTKSRWLVHLGLLAFAGLVIVHLAQRRHQIAGMLARLWGFRRRVGRELRLLLRMRSSPLSRSTSWSRGSWTGIGEPHCSSLSSRNLSTGGTCSPLLCSSCI
jgi:hypothetical protein